ncbi:MAG TPA: ABC transporter ATP-binding protein [Candidatus Kapabacteria bacterium]|nr:ABC transporter ATP-binding protein [Candidatus Kapabacteria bacterium]
MITIDRVTKQYGAFKALDEVSFHVKDGECIGLLGPNGSGKSTLYRCILGTHLYEGTIRIGGKDPLADGKHVRKNIGYMPQQASLHGDLTVRQTLQWYSELRSGSMSNALAMLERVNLSDALKLKVAELSGGMRQRLSFIVALLGDPTYLLLDEPTASMDHRSQRELLTWLYELRSEGKTIIFSTHLEQDILGIIDRTITLDQGKVVSQTESILGEMQEVISRESIL